MNPGATDAKLAERLWKTPALLFFRHRWRRTPCLGDNCLHSFISGAWLWNLSFCDRLEVIRYPTLQNRPWPLRVLGKHVTLDSVLIKAWKSAKLMEQVSVWQIYGGKRTRDKRFPRASLKLAVDVLDRDDTQTGRCAGTGLIPPFGTQHFMTCVCLGVCKCIWERGMCLFITEAFLLTFCTDNYFLLL